MKITLLFLLITLLMACGGGSNNTPEEPQPILNPPDSNPSTDDNEKLSAAGSSVQERATTIINKSHNAFESIRLTDGSYPSHIGSDSVSLGVGEGFGGIGIFYLLAYLQYGDNSYLSLAQEIASKMVININAGNLNHDWISGSVGQAEYLLLLNRVSPSEEYIDAANVVAEFLLNSAYGEQENKAYWKHWPSNPKIYTSVAHGNSGVGQFLLHLYQQSPNQQWLSLAEQTYNWLEDHWLENGDRMGWKRLSQDDFVTHSYCGGTAGILPFVYKMYEVTGEPHYLDKYVRALNGLMNYARNHDDTMVWRASVNQPAPFSGYCLGNAGIAHQLHLGGLRTGDNRFVNAAIQGANWLLEKQILSHDGQVGYWEHFENSGYTMPSIIYGNASVASSLLYFYRQTQNEQYREATERYINWLVLNAVDKDAGWLWKEAYGNNEESYQTGLLSGFSGIGVMALEFHGVSGFAFIDTAEFAKNQGLP